MAEPIDLPDPESNSIDRVLLGWTDRLGRGELIDWTVELQQIQDQALRAVAADRLDKLLLGYQALIGRNSLPPPRRIDDFELEQELGRGAMGVIYRARQISLNRPVAVKVITGLTALDPRRADRFAREAQALACLQHPGIVPVFTTGARDGVMFIAMELVDGASLGEIIAKLEAVPPPQRTTAHVARSIGTDAADSEGSYVTWVVRVCAEAAAALQYAHERGVLHRDIKPNNLMLDRSGRVRLIDFGLARILANDSSLTSFGVVGSPAYLPPEVLAESSHGATAAGDVYSLGVVLYELLAGRRPFSAKSTAALLARIERRPPPPLRRWFPALPRDLETICAKSLEKDPARRYATAAAMAADLRAFATFQPIAARRASWLRRVHLAAQRNPAASTAVLALLALAATGVVMFVGGRVRHTAAVAKAAAEVEQALATDSSAVADEALQRVMMLDDAHPRMHAWSQQIASRRCDERTAVARTALSELGAAHDHLWSLAEARDLEAEEVAARYVPPDRYSAYLRLVRECERLEAERQTRFMRTFDLIEDAQTAAAAAGQADRTAVRHLRADVFALEWRWAKRTGKVELERLHAARLREFDLEARYTPELDRPGTLTLHAPPGYAAHLFHYRPRHQLGSTDPSFRLVPVPFDGKARATVPMTGAALLPGDPCLTVIASDGMPEVEPQDLIVAIDGRTAAPGLWVKAVRPDSAAAAVQVQAWDRVVSAGGAPVSCWADVRLAQLRAGTVEFVCAGVREVHLQVPSEGTLAEQSGVEVAGAADLLAAVAPARPIPLTVLRGERLLSLQIPAGAVARIRAVPTAYPLLLAERARVGFTPLQPLLLPPGEYLLLLHRRQRDSMPLRVPFELVAGQTRTIWTVEPPHSPPHPDTIWVSGTEVDPATAEQGKTSDGVFVSRHEITLGEWDRFLSDPQIAAEIERIRAQTGALFYVPRDDILLQPKTFRQDPRDLFPVKWISQHDAQAYVDWRNRELEAAGVPWVAALPSGAEWNRAARGFTQRRLPWGNVFEPQLTDALLTSVPPIVQPVGSRLGDESPFGVRDMAGAVAEATSELHRGIENVFIIKGGANQFESASDFDIDHLDARPGGQVGSFLGFRLVYRPRQ